VDAVQQGSRFVEGQTGGIAQDGRELAAARGASGNLNAVLSGSGTSNSGSSPSDTFAALDAEASTGRLAWIHAGAQQAEAGYQDPTLGWVGVRADSSGAGVHAVLVPSSPDAAQALGSHIDGLNAYLSEHHSPVETLTLASPESRPAHSGMEQGASQNMHQGAGDGTGQNTGQNTGQDMAAKLQSNTPGYRPAISSTDSTTNAGVADQTAQTSSGGVYISVIA
jgi:hypothetical protein